MYDVDLQGDLTRLIETLETDTDVKVVVFDSADAEFFMAHIDLVRVNEGTQRPGPTGLPPWPDLLTRIEHAPFVTVASVRRRARGVGSEFILGLDMRFASREWAY